MSARINYFEHSNAAVKKFIEAGAIVKQSGLDPKLIALIDVRAAQLNGCAFCLDMHAKEAKLLGERELRLYHVGAWRDSGLFTDREKAALEWTEALTVLKPEGVSDEIYGRVREFFSEKELSDLTVAVGLINMWTRFNVAMRTAPGGMDKVMGLDKAGLT
jgi:AhpD family alkylhydroperoxidase